MLASVRPICRCGNCTFYDQQITPQENSENSQNTQPVSQLIPVGNPACLVSSALPHGAQMPPDSTDFNNSLPPGPGTVPDDHHFNTINNCLPDGLIKLLHNPNFTLHRDGYTLGNHPDLTPEHQQKLLSIVEQNRDAFAFDNSELFPYTGDHPEFKVPLTTDKKIMQPPRKYTLKEQEALDKQYQELCDLGFIYQVPVNAEYKYGCNTVVAPKKDSDGNWTKTRICNDYRQINEATPLDSYKMHLPEDLWNKAKTAKFFTKIDLRMGFMQLPVHIDSQPQTGFWWKEKLWLYRRAPFGLKNLPAHFQRVVDYELSRAGLDSFVASYIDDLLIYSDTADEHLSHIERVLKMLAAVGLHAHPDKTILAANVVEFLGHYVTNDGTSPLAAKVRAIANMPDPKDVSELRSVIGFLNYYRCYLKNFAITASPLYELLKKENMKKFPFTQEHVEAIRCLKRELCKPGLYLKAPDPNKPFILHTDWSHTGIGAVLGQIDDEKHENMIACISRSLNNAEKNYSSYRGELLAVVWAVRTFRQYLAGRRFTVYTDHRPLAYLLRANDLEGQIARWAMALQEYEMEIIYRPGCQNQNADVPSRFSLKSSEDPTGARLDEENPRCALSLALLPTTFTDMPSLLYELKTAQWMQEFESADNSLCSLVSSISQLTDTSHPLLNNQQDAFDAPTSYTEEITTIRMLTQDWIRKSKVKEPYHNTLPSVLHTSGQLPNGLPDQIHTLNTHPVGPQFFLQALTTGIDVFELCGGMSTGLEALLKCGFKIRRYFYMDTDPDAKAIAMYRFEQFLFHYPNQVPSDIIPRAFLHTPQDINQITTDILQPLIDPDTPIFLIAGWPCQDTSPAGSNRGLKGKSSSLFFSVIRILAHLQASMPTGTVGYILENAALQHNYKSHTVRTEDSDLVHSILGDYVCCDAARFGSYAHRLRNYWSNLGAAASMQNIIDTVQRDPNRLVIDVLQPGTYPQTPKCDDKFPFYCCNHKDQPTACLPTIMSYVGSYSYRDGRLGCLTDRSTNPPTVREPYASERELILGFRENTTDAPGLDNTRRCMVIGRAIDLRTLTSLISIYTVFSRFTRPTDYAAICFQLGGEDGTPPSTLTAGIPNQLKPEPATPTEVNKQFLLCLHATQEDYETSFTPAAVTIQPTIHIGKKPFSYRTYASTDIWEDPSTLCFIKYSERPCHNLEEEAKNPELRKEYNIELERIQRRAKSYRYNGNQLLRIMADGTTRVVPQFHARADIIKTTHARTGHFGVRRTAFLVSRNFWWSTLVQDTKAIVSQCPECDRSKTVAQPTTAILHNLPIMGLMYRWGVDLAGPFTVSRRGNKYLFVAIEHFSKWVEVFPIPAKTASNTAFAFAHSVLARFGAPAEVLTDGGSEFSGEFDKLLRECLIDHRTNSASRPQTNGLAERAVKTMKTALRTLVMQKHHLDEWDTDSAFISLGYNCSIQESTKLSPWELLHAHEPTLPPATKARFSKPLDIWSMREDNLAEELSMRAEIMRARMVEAGQNLAIAQQRDTLRYAKTRSGSHLPAVRTFLPGDLVYVRNRAPATTLHPKTYPLIYTIIRILDKGTVELQGRCGSTIRLNGDHCAPCHLHVSDLTTDPSLAYTRLHSFCQVCKTEQSKNMILCDACSKGFHTHCLSPPLTQVPTGNWICPVCISEGREPPTIEFPVSSYQPQELTGRKITVKIRDAIYHGTARYLGPSAGPKCIRLTCTDGTTLDFKYTDVHRVVPEPASSKPHAHVTHIPGTDLPKQWKLGTAEDLTKALRLLMPHLPWLPSELNPMLKAMPEQPLFIRADGKPISLSVSPLEILALMDTIDFSHVTSIFDPWGIYSVIREVFVANNFPCVVHSVLPPKQVTLNQSPLQPDFYEHAVNLKKLDAVVTVAPTELLDLALPLASHFTPSVACFLVCSHFLTAGPAPRLKWLQNMQQAGRLCIVCGLPKNGGQDKAVWLCIFKTPQLRSLLVKGGRRKDSVFTLG
jgi:hypothetical protein